MAVNNEFKELLADRFEAWELAEYLQIDIEDFIEAFEDEIEDALDDLSEFIGLNTDEDNREDS